MFTPTPTPPSPWAAPAYGFGRLFVCVCDSLYHFLALYGYFGAVGRLTLHTLPFIVKDQCGRPYHRIHITSWLLKEKIPTLTNCLPCIKILFDFIFLSVRTVQTIGSTLKFIKHKVAPSLACLLMSPHGVRDRKSAVHQYVTPNSTLGRSCLKSG